MIHCNSLSLYDQIALLRNRKTTSYFIAYLCDFCQQNIFNPHAQYLTTCHMKKIYKSWLNCSTELCIKLHICLIHRQRTTISPSISIIFCRWNFSTTMLLSKISPKNSSNQDTKTIQYQTNKLVSFWEKSVYSNDFISINKICSQLRLSSILCQRSILVIIFVPI